VLMVVVGRFVTLMGSSQTNVMTAKSNNCRTTVIAALDLASSNSDVYVSTCMWEVVWISSLFYALLCWDMASDRTYWKDVIWIPVTAILLPLAMWLCYVMFSKYYFRNNNGNIDIDNIQSYGADMSADRYSVESTYQVSGDVEFQRVTFSQPTIANNGLVGNINVIMDMIHSDYDGHSEVISPLTIQTNDRIV
jgi:hypothetical protein